MSQYDTNYYGGGGGGGGYLQGGSPFSASGSPGGMRRTEVSNSLRPFTVSQLNQATQAHTDAEWRVDELEIGQVTIVGQVVSVQRQTTNCVYIVEDGTGKIEARHWIDSSSDEDASKWGTIEEHRYVRVTGGLKSFGKRRYINATHIREIKDPHEIYYHILEAIAVNLILERGPPSNPNLAAPNKLLQGANSGISAYSAQNTAGAADQYSHLPPLQRDIVRFILNQPPRDEGIHVAVIAKAIGASGEDARKISDALDKLMDDGHVFTTIDDSHFNVSL
ncbi:hypothetical protein GALMADRAFT_239789 [Galerina marginata CBS 339.88]|uniref:Replication protein A C-terminal domain-containing protein n=1 Tax=Galerina marginata (strain CBS 339.88) TaxID=685588 RepID=A0A067TEM4_GALM3|nr:hypothetical protein GALMADRAFT_239789 [Galerina marginata CBS 339.88]